MSQRVRSTSTAAELEQARRRLTAGSTSARASTRTASPSRSTRAISPSDVANRYKGSKGSTGSRSATRTATSRPTRNASDRSTKADSNAARVAEVRRSTAARSAASRTQAARQSNARAAESRDVRIRNARVKAGAQTRSNNARISASRQSFANRVATARRNRSNGLNGLNGTGAIGVAGTAGLGASGYGFGGSFGVDPYYNSSFWSYWGNSYCNSWNSWFWTPFYATGVCLQNYWLNGGGYGYGGSFNNGFGVNRGFTNSIWLGPFVPAANSYIIYDDPEPEVIYVDAPAEEEGVIEGEAVVEEQAAAALPRESTDPGLQRELNRAAAYYLTQGDRAFREARFGDAAHFYAKAVEFSSDSGILYLVLSDALFATGDYRYAAYALRQAFEREPSLANNLVDKRDFYADSALFDRQLKTLETYVEDHVLDMDARLVLAANYLFSGRPDLTATLLENPFSEELRGAPEGLLLQQSANAVMFGEEPLEATPANDEGGTEF